MNKLKGIFVGLMLMGSISIKTHYHILFINDFQTHSIEAKIAFLKKGTEAISEKMTPGAVRYFKLANDKLPSKISFKKLGGMLREPEYEVQEFKFCMRDTLVVIRPYSKIKMNYYTFTIIKKQDENFDEIAGSFDTIDYLRNKLFQEKPFKKEGLIKKEDLKTLKNLLSRFSVKYEKVLFGSIKFAWMQDQVEKRLEQIRQKEKKEMEEIEAEFEIISVVTIYPEGKEMEKEDYDYDYDLSLFKEKFKKKLDSN